MGSVTVALAFSRARLSDVYTVLRGRDVDAGILDTKQRDSRSAEAGCRDQHVYWAGRAMHRALGEQLLNFLGALPGTFAHRYPAEQFMQQAPLFQAVGQGAGRVQELQLDNRACRDDACGKMVRPRLSQLVLQDPEYAGGVDQIEGRAHRR